MARRRLLLFNKSDEVGCRSRIESAFFESRQVGARRTSSDLASEGTDCPTEFCGATESVALPERHFARLTEGRAHEHSIVGNVLDAPARRAESKHVTDSRLVDHLFVEFADSPPTGGCRARAAGSRLGANHEHPKKTTIGDCAAGCHSEPLRAGPAGNRARNPVPHDARSQFSKLVTRVEPAQQVQGRGVRAARQRSEGSTLAHSLKPLLNAERFESDCGHGLLGKNVERVRGNGERLDESAHHAFGGNSRVDEVCAVFREQHSLGDLANLVTSSTDALESAGHRWR